MLRKLVADMVATAFDAIGDLKDDVTYVQYVEGAYDTETSSPTYTENRFDNVPALFTSFTEDEKDNEVMVLKDKKVLIPAKRFPAVLKSATEDTIIDGKGKTWNVRRYLGIVGEGLHIFHVRAA